MASTSISMDPGLWSRLPWEVVAVIIEHALTWIYDSDKNPSEDSSKDRDDILQKWLEIVHGSRLLRGYLLSQYWKEVHISWYDLILSPHEDAVYHTDDIWMEDYEDRREYLIVCLQENEKRGLIQNLTKWDHGVRPLQYIRVLRLWLGQNWEEMSRCLQPSHHTIQHNIELILPALGAVQDLRIDGPASDTVFGAITGLDNARLQRLQVRSENVWYEFRGTDNDRNLNIYDWTKLKHLKYLKELIVCQIPDAETQSLAKLVPSLPSLKTLSIAASKQYLMNDALDPTGSSPLQLLLYPMETHNQSPGAKDSLLAHLPPTLTKLEIIDHYHVGFSALQIPDPAEVIEKEDLPQCSLTSLLTELDDLRCTRNILKWLPHAQLEQVSFSPVPAFNEDPSDIVPLMATNEIISLHSTTLKEIILTNAWKADSSFASSFAQEWDPLFKITELILATDCIPLPNCEDSHELFAEQDLKHTLFGCGRDTTRWGSDIERLRLEMTYTTHDIIWDSADLWNMPSMKKLRILIIGPRNPCSRSRDSAENHTQTVSNIIRAAPLSLRFIQFCAFSFWIDRRDDEARLIKWETACKGENQKIKPEILSWLTKEDDDFICPDSALHRPRIAFEDGRQMRNSVELRSTLQTMNFMVARRCS